MDEPDSPSPPAPGKPRGGSFAKGNPGRPPGTKNRATLFKLSILEPHREALIDKAIELALGGNVEMLKLFMRYFLPRERPIQLDLPPIEFADDTVVAMNHITQEVAAGNILPSDGVAMASLVKSTREEIKAADVTARMDEVEATVKGWKNES